MNWVRTTVKGTTDLESELNDAAATYHPSRRIGGAAVSRVRDNGFAAFAVLAVNIALGALLLFWVGGASALSAAPSSCGTGDPATEAGTCAITIDAHDFSTGAALSNFNYIINVDNTKLPNDPTALSTESNSPIVRDGDQDHADDHAAGRALPDLGARARPQDVGQAHHPARTTPPPTAR